MKHRRPRPASSPVGGFVLLIVLVVILLASMLSVSLLFSLRADVSAQTAGASQEQAWSAAMSGVIRAIGVAQDPSAASAGWADNAAAFQHQAVVQDGDDQWYFSVYSDSDSLLGGVRFGLSDENGKLPVHHAPTAWLARLPNMDEPMAHALAAGSPTAPASGFLDFSAPAPAAPAITDGIPEPPAGLGPAAPTSTAPSLPWFTPEMPAGPSLEEIFAEAGLPPGLLRGEDSNLNLRLDANEDDAEASPPPDDRNGLLDAGLQRFLAVDSYDLNVDADGHPRINLNDPTTALDNLGLPQAAQDFIAARRRANRPLAHPAQLLGAEEDLPNAAGQTTRLKSGIGADELPTVLDRCTTTNATRLEGLINVNTAPAPVLAAIPALGESGADAIVAARAGLTLEERRTPAWILRRGLVNAEQFKELAPHLTSRSYQFTFRSIGYAVPSGRYRVLAAAIDVATHPARILAVRDLTRFGFPLPIEVLQGAGN